MALDQQTTLIRLRFRDNDGTESTCQVNFAPNTSISDIINLVGSFRSLVQDLSTAYCVGADVVLRWTETGVFSTPYNANVRRSGAFSFETAATTLAFCRIPSIDQDLLLIEGPYAGIGIDTSIPAVSSYVSAITGGISGISVCDPFGNDLTELSQAFIEQF